MQCRSSFLQKRRYALVQQHRHKGYDNSLDQIERCDAGKHECQLVCDEREDLRTHCDDCLNRQMEEEPVGGNQYRIVQQHADREFDTSKIIHIQ